MGHKERLIGQASKDFRTVFIVVPYAMLLQQSSMVP
jgi:hypothetical protein